MNKSKKRWMLIIAILIMSSLIIPITFCKYTSEFTQTITFSISNQNNNEARVGNIEYATLQEALTAAKNLGGHQTVTVLKDIQLSAAATVASGSDITLDLQNYTISNGVQSINIIKNSGTLEIIGGANGTITSDTGYGAIDNDATGNITVSSGKIIATGIRQAIYNAGGTVEVTGTAYLSSSASDRATIQNYKPNNANAGTITISGGTIVSTTTTSKGAVQNEATGTVIVTGGTITSEKNMGIDNAGTLRLGIKDGDCDDTSPVIQGSNYGVKTTGSGTVEFYDGIVKGKTHAFNDENYITETEDFYFVDHDTETIGENSYEVAFLDTAENVLIFYGNGGTPDETTVNVPNDTAIGALLPGAPTRPHYSFDGWFTDPDQNSGTQITASTVITGHGTYYAHWTQTEAIVTYNANGGTMDGTNEEDAIVVNIGSSIGSANLPTPTRIYKTFVGWYTDPNQNSGTLIDGTETILQDVTYYAHWSAVNVTVNFDPNSGTIPQADASKTVEAGDAVGELPTTATNGNQYFAGWFTDPTDGTRVKETDIIGDTTVTYYAHWISTAVAKIGAVHYDTLQNAIREVPTNNIQTTVLLLQDQIEAVEIITNQNIILDLQNYTLRNNGTAKLVNPIMQPDKRAVVIENYGTLTVTNGTIANSTGQSAINKYADLTLDGIILTITGKRQGIYNTAGTILITGNSYLSATSTTERALIQGFKPTNGTTAGTITIDGATLVSATTSDKAVIENPATGTLIIKNATITSTNKRGIDNKGTLRIGVKDGSVSTSAPAIEGKIYGVSSTTGFEFYDGIIKGETAAISNRTVTIDVEDGYEITDDTDGSYHTVYLSQIP